MRQPEGRATVRFGSISDGLMRFMFALIVRPYFPG